MLSVHIDGREVEATPVALARMVLDGTVERDSPCRSSGAASEQSLEQSLGAFYGEALTSELLQRIRSMYSPQSPADLQSLRLRVEDLCQWRWTNPHIAARLLWTAAWLNELMGRIGHAVSCYDAFLQTSCREGHLRILAYNNRGALRIRLGRLEGVQDLLRAAIPHEPAPTELARSMGLPAACFNLLNLLNVSLFVESLTEAVDEELADFFSQLSEEVRTLWLGPDSGVDDSEVRVSDVTDPGDALRVLRDTSYRRVNTLVVRLASQARKLGVTESRAGADHVSAGANQLHLWECRSDGQGHNGNGNGERIGPHGPCAADRFAEAAGLLLGDDIPAALLRAESPLNRAEQLAYEELADVEGRLAIHQRELTKSRLQVQHRILSSLNRRGRLAGLLARVDAQIERVTRLEVQEKQLGFQRGCGRLVDEVEQFCRISDPCRADRELHDLNRRLRDFRSQAGPHRSREVLALLDELTARVERHVHRLKRLEIRKRIRRPLRNIRQNWPSDWTVPVSESVYQSLAQCHLNDPQGWIEDWVDLREQLDAHQAQHHLRRAFSVLQADYTAWDAVLEDLVAGLSFRPQLWLTVAPLFGLVPVARTGEPPQRQAEMWVNVQGAAKRLLDTISNNGESSGGNGNRRLMQRAATLLGRAFEKIDADARKLLSLWQCVEATTTPILGLADAGAIAQVKAVAEACLDHWPVERAEVPGCADPRNPVNCFLEMCEKAQNLAEAEQWLNVRPPRCAEAGKRFAQLLVAGLDTRDQLKRVVIGSYLAEFCQADAPHVQRQVLARLEAWIDALPVEASRRLGPQDFSGEMERIRSVVSTKRSTPLAVAPRPGEPVGKAVEPRPKRGDLHRKDGPSKDSGNSAKEQAGPER